MAEKRTNGKGKSAKERFDEKVEKELKNSVLYRKNAKGVFDKTHNTKVRKMYEDYVLNEAKRKAGLKIRKAARGITKDLPKELDKEGFKTKKTVEGSTPTTKITGRKKTNKKKK